MICQVDCNHLWFVVFETVTASSHSPNHMANRALPEHLKAVDPELHTFLGPLNLAARNLTIHILNQGRIHPTVIGRSLLNAERGIWSGPQVLHSMKHDFLSRARFSKLVHDSQPVNCFV